MRGEYDLPVPFTGVTPIHHHLTVTFPSLIHDRTPPNPPTISTRAPNPTRRDQICGPHRPLNDTRWFDAGMLVKSPCHGPHANERWWWSGCTWISAIMMRSWFFIFSMERERAWGKRVRPLRARLVFPVNGQRRESRFCRQIGSKNPRPWWKKKKNLDNKRELSVTKAIFNHG